MKLATDSDLDLLTIDGSGDGTGMSPWNMMETWDVPSINLHANAYKYANILASQGKCVIDMAFAGGLALGAPFTKLICRGRSVMIPGYLGSNIEGAIYPERKKNFPVTGTNFRLKLKNSDQVLKRSLPDTRLYRKKSAQKR